MVIDVHGHLGHINQAPFWSADWQKLDAYCRQADVGTLCISSARSLMYDVREGNAEVDAAVKASDRLLGYAVINPVFPETFDELRWLESNDRFRGVKMHPDYHGYDLASPAIGRFIDRVAAHTPLMLFHASCMPGTGFAAATRIAAIAERHPKTNFIIAHMAGIYQNSLYPYFPNLQGCEEIAALGLKNVYVDTAHHLMYVYPGVMQKMVDLLGPEQIVFGTDVPLQGPMQIRFAIEMIQSLDISEADKHKIIAGNAAEILRLK